MAEQNPFLVATDARLKKIYDELENEAYDEKQHTYDYKITNQIIRANFTKLFEAQTIGQAETLVMPKIADVIENKKQKILSSLNEYLAETNPSEKHGQHLQIIADCEIQICNELLKEFKSNFSA